MLQTIVNGSPAPDFTLYNQDQKQISLKDFRNRWLILYFYPKDDTPGCTRESIEFTQALSEIRSLGAVVVGVSPDDIRCHQAFIRKYDLAIELLSDPDKKLLTAYNVWQEKTNYGKTYMGVVRSTFIISPDGKIAHTWRNVKVDGHVALVVAKLRALQAT